MGPAATREPEREHPGLQGNALSHGSPRSSSSLVWQDVQPTSPESRGLRPGSWPFSMAVPSAHSVLPRYTAGLLPRERLEQAQLSLASQPEVGGQVRCASNVCPGPSPSQAWPGNLPLLHPL